MTNIKKERPQVTVVDSIMGSGKTESAINMINRSADDVHYMYITPYLDEVKRIIHSCPNKKFKQPRYQNGSKMYNIKQLINKGENIVSTHALFKKFNKETIELAYINNYILIMDEVADVVDIYDDCLGCGANERTITPEDIKTILEKYAYVDPDTYLLRWTDDTYPDNGLFSNVKRLAQLDSLTVYNNYLFLWLFPISVFKAFQHIYILTYLFDSQMQKYYYDLFNVDYEKKSATKKIGRYTMVDYNVDCPNINKINYKELITIEDNEKINNIGLFDYSLSSTWYLNASKETLKKLKNNIYNFFRQYSCTKSNENLWTTFKKYKTSLAGGGYSKGFIPLNSRATNEYRNRIAIAYPVNRYLNPMLKNYFLSHDVKVNEDEYALSEMLQFIWRSAIRDNKPITLYIPSERMRRLLIDWIENMCKGMDKDVKDIK